MTIREWAENYLLLNGYTISSPAIDVRTTPWSQVMRFKTSKGTIYLKQIPEALSLEPTIMQILHDQFHAQVPIVLATSKEFSCFLMTSHGIPLRDFFKEGFQPDLLATGLKIYTFIQDKTSKHLDSFFTLGVPDWRLDKLPSLYKTFINENADLLTEDGITPDELSRLNKLYPVCASLCERLANYQIPQTLDHCDFHDNNILIEPHTNTMTIIDWGESVITHPFFSAITCLQNVVSHYAIKETDAIYLQLRNTCFEPWLALQPSNHLIEVFSLTKQLWPLYTTFSEYRLRVGTNSEAFQLLHRQGRLTRGLRAFIQSVL